ncbi:hypothetical protein DsansV1_C09g0091791 [Dioscorea sansibarensis]
MVQWYRLKANGHTSGAIGGSIAALLLQPYRIPFVFFLSKIYIMSFLDVSMFWFSFIGFGCFLSLYFGYGCRIHALIMYSLTSADHVF